MSQFRKNLGGKLRPALLATAFTALTALVPASPALAAEPVNINTADAVTLAAAIDGVGIKRAQAIVADRDTFGPFTSVEALSRVRGVSARTVERNKPKLTAR